MKNLEKTKMILGYILIGFSVFGILLALLDQFNLCWLEYPRFGPTPRSGASNAPIFYGLTSIAGSILLATVKNTDEEE